MQSQRRLLGLAPWQWIALLGSCFIVLVLTLNPRGAGEAHAYTITGDQELIINASAVDVRIVTVEASYDNLFGLSSPVNRDIFKCVDGASDSRSMGEGGPSQDHRIGLLA